MTAAAAAPQRKEKGKDVTEDVGRTEMDAKCERGVLLVNVGPIILRKLSDF